MKRKEFLLPVVFLGLCLIARAQEIGANFNHNPEIINFDYLKKVKVEWIRTTPRIFDYIEGELELKSDTGLQKVIQAGEKGYKIAFGFRWDFKMRNKRLPEPNSEEEKLYFEYARKILQIVGPHIDIFKLGNEPNLETLPEDLLENEEGVVPLVRFTKRQLTEVVEPYFKERDSSNMPNIYIGSFPRLFMKEEQQKIGIRKMIELANNDDKITGLAVHLHISDILQIDQSFEFVRGIMPNKAIIVPEFSFHRLYLTKLSESITVNKKGKAFVRKYGHNPNWKLYQWFGHANTNRVSPEEWKDLFETLDWFPEHNLRAYYDRFRKYGVVLATYPLFQQSCPKNMTPNSPAWFINPVFYQQSLIPQNNGDYTPSPLYYEDFVSLVQRGKKTKRDR
ncbi:hypothetical protein [Arenibacter sp. S6351L]|uniref:hypothetical protein n=1 Tax=Arenibacter sp. S6351L TaxID=2926407 RepID=UPI001FF4F150|nr:hypothetical protein [Arenibacter sp. S6351L]MCK0137005.1 hypothetical protein [Arenibacter sp. S6351L]